jgi:hypothetical protein
MTDVALNWTTAKVKDGKLTVDLEGDVASGWKRSFEGTARLLPGGEWGKIQVKKQTVRVSDVTIGVEDKLRHHLESIVEQANADERSPEPEGDNGDDRDTPDARMTEAFRSFAENDEAET